MRKLVTLLFAAMLSLSVAVGGFAADKAPAAKPADKTVEKAAPAAKEEFIDINSATEPELKAIHGIGDAYSKKIVAGRPYAKKDQLASKKILPKAVYDKIKDKIVVKQPKK
jgi:DNA uptake protein ComE-like DNA-binding protein